VLDGLVKPRLLIGINAALKPYGGVAAGIFPTLAKMLVMNPFMPRFFAWQAGEARAVSRLIEGTGSRLDEAGLVFYQRLFSSRVHVAATLAMMAQWDLQGLQADFARLSVPLHLIVALNDKAVSPEEAREMKAKHPAITLHFVKGLGHLSHEEKPAEAAAMIGTILSAE
jgi:magnesium chelatase accessory protein